MKSMCQFELMCDTFFISDGVSDLHTVIIPISGAYLLSLNTQIINNGTVILRRNRKEILFSGGEADIIVYCIV